LLTKGPGLSDLTEAVRGVFFLVSTRYSPAFCREEGGDGGQHRGSELIGGEAEKVPAALLVHLPPSVPPTAAGRGGTTRAQKLAGVDGYGYRERDGEGDDV
jgi:hypothetical protein